MKKMIVLAVLVVGCYLLYKNCGSSPSNKGAFDAQGNATVILFTMENCGSACSDVIGALKERNIVFEEIDIMSEEGRRRFEAFGERGVPLTVIGRRKILGSNLDEITTVLAETYGGKTLNGAEQSVMGNHFDETGNPRVVMYGASWCPYCRQAKEYFARNNIPYVEIDVDKSSLARRDYDILKGRGYPLIYVGYRRISGYSEEAISQAVRELLKRS